MPRKKEEKGGGPPPQKKTPGQPNQTCPDIQNTGTGTLTGTGTGTGIGRGTGTGTGTGIGRGTGTGTLRPVIGLYCRALCSPKHQKRFRFRSGFGVRVWVRPMTGPGDVVSAGSGRSAGVQRIAPGTTLRGWG